MAAVNCSKAVVSVEASGRLQRRYYEKQRHFTVIMARFIMGMECVSLIAKPEWHEM